MNLLNSDYSLRISPKLAAKIGLNEAVVLQQVSYWITNSKSVGVFHEGKKWVYNTYSEWVEQLPFFSERTVQRIFLKLESLGLLESKMMNKGRGDRTKHYTVNYSSEILKFTSAKPAKSSIEPDWHDDNDNLASSSRQVGMMIVPDWHDDNDNLASSSRQVGTLLTKTTTKTTTKTSSKITDSAQEALTTRTKKPSPPKTEKPKTSLGVPELVNQYEVPEQVAADWLAIRKLKKLPLTLTALNRIVSEAAKAGLTVPQAIQFACEENWAGFKAEWYQNRQPQAQGRPRGGWVPPAIETPAQRAERYMAELGQENNGFDNAKDITFTADEQGALDIFKQISNERG